MQDFQVLHHSLTAFLFRVSPVNVIDRKCGLSDMLSFRYHWFSSRSHELTDNHWRYT
jgi:hypothetical protein